MKSKKTIFLKDCQERLETVLGTNDILFESDVWTGKRHIINFSEIPLPFNEDTEIIFQGDKIKLPPLEFIKWFFLCLVCDAPSRFGRLIPVLSSLFAVFSENNCNVLYKKDIEYWFSLLISCDYLNGEFIQRLSTPSCKTRLSVAIAIIPNVIETCNRHGIPNIFEIVTSKEVTGLANNASLAQLDMTYQDYNKGGSFNFLGLDIGRHYIDHCGQRFEEHLKYVYVCRQILNNESITKKLVASDNNIRQNYKEIENEEAYNRLKVKLENKFVQSLMGHTPDNYYHSHPSQILSKERNENIHRITIKSFCDYYNNVPELITGFSLANLKAIASECNLDTKGFDTIEFIRVMQFTRLCPSIKSRQDIFNEYKSSLDDTKTFRSLSLEDFDRICSKISKIDRITPANATSYLKKHIDVLVSGRNTTRQLSQVNLLKLLQNHEESGITTLVAYLGWRKSEYGFQLSNLFAERNTDPLDGNYIPLRHYVKWKIPKVFGEQLIDREITLTASVLIHQLTALTLEKCRFAISSRDTNEIGSVIDIAVESNWESFVKQYRPFSDLDLLFKLQENIHNLNDTQRNDYHRLVRSYDLSNSKTKSLIKMRDKLRSDLDRIQIINKRNKLRRCSVIIPKFIKGELPDDEMLKLDSYLSDETKQHLTNELLNGKGLSTSSTDQVMSEILDDVAYPTPHGLRHIWAEAVLRRYRGDIGKFIRANFKHIDESYFMAYLRDKETELVFRKAERVVISDVVRDHINAMQDDTRGYAGKFDRFLSKAIQATQVVTEEEYNQLIQNISGSVISYKGNPWSSCLLRKGFESSAKCSELGVPQRHKASPKLCIDCVNADIVSANFRGIVITIKPDVDALRNPSIPEFIKAPHRKLVTDAVARLEELRRNEGTLEYNKYIAYLYETLEMSRKPTEYPTLEAGKI
jgi:hypothetical protein